jgi:saxitoxin biosynthesis operon SxtJ-like protein
MWTLCRTRRDSRARLPAYGGAGSGDGLANGKGANDVARGQQPGRGAWGLMSSTANHHELTRRDAETETSSDRSFGLVFAGFFALLAGYNGWHHRGSWPLWLAIAAVFLVLALARPQVLAPLNRIWTRLGLLLGRIVSPIVLALMYFLVVTPIGMLMRWLGKDPLRLRGDPAAQSYWIVREPPGPPGETMRDQF